MSQQKLHHSCICLSFLNNIKHWDYPLNIGYRYCILKSLPIRDLHFYNHIVCKLGESKYLRKSHHQFYFKSTSKCNINQTILVIIYKGCGYSLVSDNQYRLLPSSVTNDWSCSETLHSSEESIRVWSAVGYRRWVTTMSGFWACAMVRTWIYNAICHGLFVFNGLRWEVIVCFVWYWWTLWPSLFKKKYS